MSMTTVYQYYLMGYRQESIQTEGGLYPKPLHQKAHALGLFHSRTTLRPLMHSKTITKAIQEFQEEEEVTHG